MTSYLRYSFCGVRATQVHRQGCSDAYLASPGRTEFPNNTVLERTEIPSMYTLLKQRRLRWLGHFVRMDDSPILKNLLYGELANGKRPTGRPQLRCL